MKYFSTFTFCLFIRISFSQNFYFPPTSGNTWDTLSPNRLGWCSTKIDSFYIFLEANNTKRFIFHKGGKLRELKINPKPIIGGKSQSSLFP